MIAGILPLRGTDAFGSGYFGAPRGDKKHRGIDYACYPKTEILSPTKGIVSKFGYTYQDDLSFRYVQITDLSTGYKHRLFYVEPDTPIGSEVQEGDYVGYSQDISGRYSTIQKYMKNHVHYEIKQGSVYLDPDEVHNEES